mmetsp:Transcript_20927/g.80583  ORF Transcript_20927/g.80583 Transcript_20927/m.80583 type:complete len:454 (-) Transcript_20927:185-1546(-)
MPHMGWTWFSQSFRGKRLTGPSDAESGGFLPSLVSPLHTSPAGRDVSHALPPRPKDASGIQTTIRGHHAVQAELFTHTRKRSLRKPPAQLGVLDKPGQCLSKRAGMLGGHQQSIGLGLDELGVAANRCRHRGTPASHGLQQRVADALGLGGQREDVDMGQQLRHIAAVARQPSLLRSTGIGQTLPRRRQQRACAQHDEAQTRPLGRALLAQAQECIHEVQRVFHGLHTANGTDDEVLATAKRPVGRHRRGRAETQRVDAVADPLHTLGRETDRTGQVRLNGLRECHESMRAHAIDAAQALVRAADATQVADIPAMLAVHAQRYPRRPGRPLELHRAEVSRVHHGRAQLAQQAIDTRIEPQALAWRLVQCDELGARRGDPLLERSDLGDRHDGMPEGRQVVDDVDNTVLQPSRVEAVKQVDDQRPRVVAHGFRAARRGSRHPAARGCQKPPSRQ